VALASGAGFIARGFSGDPNGVAKLLVEAIQYPGFSLVQILSPCVTYRPEEKDWKHQVHAAGQGLGAYLGLGRLVVDRACIRNRTQDTYYS